MSEDQRIHVIGFNKCGTRSLARWFESAGLSAAHWLGGALGETLRRNMAANRPPFEGLDRYDCYLDLAPPAAASYHFEGCRAFRYIHRWRPDDWFILNTRDEDDWIESRFRHMRGLYAARCMKRRGVWTARALERLWREDWRRHHDEAREYFAARGAKFIEHHITRDDPARLAAHLAPVAALDPEALPHRGRAGRRSRDFRDIPLPGRLALRARAALGA